MAEPKKSTKKVQGYVKLQIKAGQANPSPPVGPALGQAGVNIMEFCKAFNEATKAEQPGTPIPVVITVYADRSFTFITKLPPVSYYLLQAVGLKKGAQNPGKEVAGKITMAQLREIAGKKMADLNAFTVEAATSMIRGSALAMGLEIVE